MALSVDFENKQINVTSPQSDVLVQDLLDYIREYIEPGCEGIVFPQVASASGKESLGGAVSTGITLELLDDWQLKFWDGNYVATISGGNLLGGVAGDPVAYTAGVQVVIIQSAASTLVVTGSGVTPDDKQDIIGGVWDALYTEHSINNSFGKIMADILTDTGTTLPSSISSLNVKIDSVEAVAVTIEKLTGYKVTKTGDVITIFDTDGVTPWRSYDLSGGGRVQV